MARRKASHDTCSGHIRVNVECSFMFDVGFGDGVTNKQAVAEQLARYVQSMEETGMGLASFIDKVTILEVLNDDDEVVVEEMG
jgi:hypothetical protein